ncbi:hypothetical protein LTR53_016005, partial [Teratosphaeriaceae sp. CCFEE 6253]
ILRDQGLVGKLSDKTFLVTGATSGLGYETVRVLLLSGAKVIITGRTQERADAAAATISATSPDAPAVKAVAMDLASLGSVRRGAEAIQKLTQSLNVLVANAGMMAALEGESSEGHELQFAVNHLAHFLLFGLLRPTLQASAASGSASRVIVVSSIAHRIGSIHTSNYSLTGEYDPWMSYGQSKLANILMALELEKRYGGESGKIHALSLHPGMIADTTLAKHQGGGDALMNMFSQQDEKLTQTAKTVQQGAATQIWAAVAAELEGKGGLYLADCQVAKPYVEGAGSFSPGYGPLAYDEVTAKTLWDDSRQMVGLENGASE